MHPDDTPGRVTDPPPDWPALLGRFLPAPPELVARRELRRRADAKYLLTPSAAAELLGVLAGDYAVLASGTGLVARYRTLYFDTAELDFFHDQRRGRRVRHKVRIRHYPDRRLSVLEVKTRRSELETSKAWRARPYGDSALGADDRAFIASLTGIGRPVVPQVWTEFRRVALLGLHTNERITVDLDIGVRAGPWCRSMGAVAILEVKQWPHRRDTPVLEALRAVHRRPTSISKYCSAIAVTWPGVRHNRLLPALRGMERAA